MTRALYWRLSSLGFGLLSTMACVDLIPDVGRMHPTGTTGDSGLKDGGGNGGNDDGGENDGSGSTGDDLDGSLPDGDAEPPDNGCAIKDSKPDQDVSFSSDVWMILEGCRCHNSSDADPFGILESGLAIDGYASLRKGGSMTGTDIIVAGNPCESVLLSKLGDAPEFGERMPLDGPYLTEEQTRLLSDWIAEGARDN
jgi:hypothetical protein